MKFFVLLFLLSGMMAPSAFAYTASHGKVETYLSHGSKLGNRFFIIMENKDADMPPCAQGFKRYAVDLSKPEGQTIASIVITAKVQGKSLRIFGNGTCSVWGDSEDIAWIETIN